MGVLSPVGNHYAIAEQADKILRMPKHDGNTSFLFDSYINAKKVTSDPCAVIRRLLICYFIFPKSKNLLRQIFMLILPCSSTFSEFFDLLILVFSSS